MITTNVNDYAIQPNGLHGIKAKDENDEKEFQHKIQVQEVPQRFKDAKMMVKPDAHSPGHPLDEGRFERPPTHREGAAASNGSWTPFHVTELPKQTPPRRLESELALIVDKEFQEKFAEDFPDQPDQDSLILFLVDTVNWMQMW